MRTLACLALTAALLACTAVGSKTDDRAVTDWFTVRQYVPGKVGGAPRHQSFFTAVEGKWVAVGEGDLGRVMVLDGGAAVLYATGPGEDLLLIHRGDTGPQKLGHLLPPGQPVAVSPDGRFVDVPRCEGRGLKGCVSLEVARYDVRARIVTKKVVGLPQSQAGCDFPGLVPIGYDEYGNAYFAGRCEGLDALCILVAPRPGGLLVRQRSKPAGSLVCDQPGFWTEALGYELKEPARFTQLPVAREGR